MENKFTSFAYEEERSTYTEGESRSKRSSILKPPKARAPLQEVNLGGSADETGDFDTLRKRRVSFAGVNSVKEFCSNAESAQVCHIQSYEETFSTSSDNSHNSSGARSQLGTPKNVSSTEDKNFVDDPMDLTDSIIDNNPIGSNRSALVVRVEPVLTANALSEGEGFLRNPQGQSWNARKSALEHEEGQSWNARSSHGPNWASGGEEYNARVKECENLGAVPRRPQPDESANPHWSCSMEMTEPVHLKKRQSTTQQSENPFQFGRNSSKPESDSGMELTEAVGKTPNHLVDDNFGDASMEMTDVVSRGRKYMAFTSSTNKSASMEFTEVVRKKQTPFNVVQSPFSGMELTEPVEAPHHEPVARHSLFSAVEEGKPKPRVSYSCTLGKTAMQSPGNKSSSDMEMTGVLSLSKASRLVANQEADDMDDMDFTQIIIPSMPLRKKFRLSAEDDEDPFPIGRRLETDPADKENLKLPLVELSISTGPEAEQVMESAPKNNIGKPAEEDDDTLALNFNNVKRGNSPVELSFLKEFKDSSPVSEAPRKSHVDLFSSKKPLKYDVPDEHLLLFSLSTTEDRPTPPAVSEPKETAKESNFDLMISHEPNIPSGVSKRSSVPNNEYDSLSGKPELFKEDDFLARPEGHRTNIEQLRGVRKSAGAENDSNLPPVRMSFKDFEIKADLTTTVMMHASLSTVGLDDSNILKAGFNDLTYPLEQVPACASQLDITARTPRPSAPDNTTLARSTMTPDATTLDRITENSPDRPGIAVAGAVTRKSELDQDPLRGEDDTTHSLFSSHMPSYKSLSDAKHPQNFPALDLELAKVVSNHARVTVTPTETQSSGPRTSVLSQNLPESCSMELTEVLSQKSIPSGRLSTNPKRVSRKVDYTDKEMAESISTEETLLRKSMPCVRADEPSPERPSSMDETNLAEPVCQDKYKPFCQPAQSSPASIASEVTVCKSNVTNCAVERIDSGDAIESEETFAKSKTITDPVTSQAMATTKNAPRLSQPHPKSHFFPRMSVREETAPSELTDNHLINAGLNSTFSFQNFGGKDSTKNVVEPPRKSAPAFANLMSDFHDDGRQAGEHFFASRRVNNISVSFESLRGEVQPEDRMVGTDAKDATPFDPQPKPQIRMPRKSHFFSNLEEGNTMSVEASKDGTHQSSDSDFPLGKTTRPAEYSHKSAGCFAEEVSSHARKSVEVIPMMNAESTNMQQNLPKRGSETQNGYRRSMGLPVQDALQVQRKSGFTDLLGKKSLADGEPEKPILGHAFGRYSVGLFDEKNNFEESRKSVKIGQDFNVVSSSDQYAESNFFPTLEGNIRASRKSMKVTSSVNSEGSSEALNQPSEESLEPAIDERINCESIGGEDESQATEKSERVTCDFNVENEPLEGSSECADDECSLPRNSVGLVGQEVEGQEPTKSVRMSPKTFEGPNDIPHLHRGLTDGADVVNAPDAHSNGGESLDSTAEIPKRTPRKSCIGVQMDSSTETKDQHRKISLCDVSEGFEFAIKRNKRKSAVGVKMRDIDADRESQNPDVDSGIKVSRDDVHQGWSTDEDPKMSPEDSPGDNLSQGMMNVSINDDEDDVKDFSDDERMHVSTPCKPRLSSRLRDDGRKRSLKADPRSSSDEGGVHDLSQELMNVSLESDARSPMLKKTCASPQVSIPSSTNSVRKSLAPKSPPARSSSASFFERRAVAPTTAAPASGSAALPSTWSADLAMTENIYASLWSVSHDIRVKNRDFMAANGFTLLNRQIYEIWLFGEVIGLKTYFPNCKIAEDTNVVGVTYTFKEWKLGTASCILHTDVYDFYKNRLLETLPEKQLKRECRVARDLFRIAHDLKKLEADSKPLIDRMTHLKLRYPCEIKKHNIEFLIGDARYMLTFAVKIDVRSDPPGEGSISVVNLRGHVKEDLVKLMFRVLTPTKDMFYTFVKELRNNTERLVAR